MEYRKLGASGVRVSAISLGGWLTYGHHVKDEKLVARILRAAKDAGVNFFDIADVYGRGEAERVMGRVLNDFPRHELVISSKVYWPMSDDPNDRGLSRKHVIESVERSLKRIGTDYLDLYFCHRHDDETPLEETARAMDDLVRQGKILYWGTSEWTGEQLRSAHRLADRRNFQAPVVEQPEYSLLVREKVETDVGPASAELGMGLVVWSPLASGLLTGKYDAGIPTGSRLQRVAWLREEYDEAEALARVRRMKEIADRKGCTRAQLALAWALRQPGISSVITGASRVEQLDENLRALEVVLDDEAQRELDTIFPRA